MTGYTAEEIAAVVHDAQRRLQRIQHDPAPAPEWERAGSQMRHTASEGVRAVAGEGLTPRESHERWCEQMRHDGWTTGPEKDPARKTHPCLVPYEDLPAHQRDKDELFVAITRALIGEGLKP
jgi:hypothetical protein